MKSSEIERKVPVHIFESVNYVAMTSFQRYVVMFILLIFFVIRVSPATNVFSGCLFVIVCVFIYSGKLLIIYYFVIAVC